MIQHDTRCIMLRLTDAQGKIIESIVKYDADELGNIGYGLTSYKIETLGINRRTFTINVDELIENNFLYLIRSDMHYSGRRTEHKDKSSPWNYYQVSTLGFLAYQNWLRQSQKNKTGIITRKYFPLITEHWKTIHKLYGQVMIEILIQTTNQINVEPQFKLIHKETKKKIFSRKLVDTLTLNIGTIDVIFYRNLGEIEIVKPNKKKITQIYDQTRNKEINKAVRDRFTFAFYFNLINFGFDTGKMIEYIFTNKPPFYSKGKKIYFKDMNILAKSTQIFQNKMKKNSKLVIKIINDNPKLYRLFKQTLDEVHSKLSQRKIIKLLNESIK